MIKSKKTLIKQIINFLEYCEVEKGLSPVSVKNYAQFLSKFSCWLEFANFGALLPHQLSPDHIWKYRLFLAHQTSPLTHKPLSKATQNYYLIALRVLLAYLTEKDILSLPVEKIKLSKNNKSRKIKFLTLEQLEKLLSMPNIKTKTGLRDKAILETLFSTGLRVSELMSLNVNQIKIEKLPKGKDLEVVITGKGENIRTVYFSPRCLEWIDKYLKARKDDDDDKALFINFSTRSFKSEKRLSTRSIERIIKSYARQAGLPYFITPHTIRHSFATDLLNQGVDLRIIQEFLGHKNIATTQVYTHVTNKKLRQIHQEFHSGARLKNE
ncbi:MAG: hypothetical protein Athens101410_5 [Parcubacteria group bacterium Athens1014_10]|nr:MAG: hypothetical protein Athens101410_5 [Parcubacteria group bacterium Athens1014_10]TSD06031.1 MAG: hypothetical protein Athens071412_5 [Parcubacteria group bacterium Athens0714_12]